VNLKRWQHVSFALTESPRLSRFDW